MQKVSQQMSRLFHGNYQNMMTAIAHFDEAMNQPDAIEFVKAIIKEINEHVDNGNWELVPRNMVSEGANPVLSMWSM